MNMGCAHLKILFGDYLIVTPTFAFSTRGVHRMHTLHGTSTGYSAATIDSTDMTSLNRRDISAYAHRTGAIAHTVFVYGHIQGVGVTTCRM